MRDRGGENSRESGQVLILFAFMITVVVMFLVMVIDVGAFVMQRRDTQNDVDAIALAAAQELPDSTANAIAVAQEYATLNGLDPDDLVITFSCTSTDPRFCNEAEGKYDTINITTTQKAPAMFGGIMGLIGDGNSCYTDGCETTLEAAACRGSCGLGAAPVDTVVAIDHTGSMSDTDLQNAKDGALTLMAVMNASFQRVGLGVTPPVHPTDTCDTIEAWDDPQTWLPVGLTDQFQTAPQVLDNGSTLVSTTNCLDRATGATDVPGPHTDLANPVKAAMAELAANGRPEAKQAIVLFSDGAANIWTEVDGRAIGAKGPCDYAYKVAQSAAAAGYIVYSIAYGADDTCSRDDADSPWYNRPAEELLEAMASDPANFYNAPRSSDLDPIFQAIGEQLVGGSKLVK